MNNRRYKAKECGHCGQFLQKSAYYEHRRSYFDPYGHWKKCEKTAPILVDNPPSPAIPAEESDIQSGGTTMTETMSVCAPCSDSASSDILTIRNIEDLDYISSDTQSDVEDEQHAIHETVDIDTETLFRETAGDPESCCSEIWESDEDVREAELLNEESATNEDSSIPKPMFQILVDAMMFFLLLWQKCYNVSDRGITILLKFMKQFLLMCSDHLELPLLIELASYIPLSLYKVRQLLGLNRDDFDKYVVCPKCAELYRFQDCYRTDRNGLKIPLKCSFIRFPKHPQRKHRQPCNSPLLKKVKGNMKEYLYPIKLYCYKSLKQTLQSFLRRPNFLNRCNQWRNRNIPEGVMSDIYDGKVWKDFVEAGFFSSDYDLSLTLNVDWFQPYEHSPYSAGAIYMVINNLPREERFNAENVILVGVLPGPDEPKKNLNSYLKPLVAELQELVEGVKLEDGSMSGNTYRAIVMCLSSDIPACRKCGGFVGHGALRGCSKCLKTFPRETFGAKADYSGYSPDNYPPRCDEDHKSFAVKVENAATLAEQNKHEREYGARWTELNNLPYYHPVRFHVIDPMHNLLLGTAKHVTQIWKDKGVIDGNMFSMIQSKVDGMKVPGNVGRIPRKIASGFSGFTADQWKNWVLIFSQYALKDIISNDQYNCWGLFVNACRIMCSKVISTEQVLKAHDYLHKFCMFFRQLHGSEACTINMHLHLHLKDCLLDYGPVYAFWCFSFERYNGILGNYPTNNQGITVQLMRKFTLGQQIEDKPWPECIPDLRTLLGYGQQSRGTCEATSTFQHVVQRCTETQSAELTLSDFREQHQITVLPPEQCHYFDSDDTSALTEMYALLYNPSNILNVICIAERYKRVSYAGNLYSIERSRNNRSACVMAKWVGNESSDGMCSIDLCSDTRPCIIQEIFRSEVTLSVGEKIEKVPHILARVVWLKRHPMKNHYGNHTQVWGTDIETVHGAAFIPVQRIQCLCVCTQVKVSFPYCQLGERVSVVVPLENCNSDQLR